MSNKIASDIEECVRNNVQWQNLSIHLREILNTPKDYDRYVFNYSLKNQLRFRGNLVRRVFKNEQRYYELLIDKSVNNLCIFPYHLADIVTKGLRVTPFNYYLDVIGFLLKNDKSYDTLPNFTAADCLRVLGIGRNEYMAIVSELKTNSSKLFWKPSPSNYLPKFPVHIVIEPWWKVEVGYILESDIKYVNDNERSLIDDLIDFGSRTAGQLDYNIVHSLYRKGLIYLDVPISGDDKISIPPLKNFVMNRVSGDYFENLLYKIFVTADEYQTIHELSQMLQIHLDSVKHAVSLCCRLGFAKKKNQFEITDRHGSWNNLELLQNERPQITPLNFHSLLINDSHDGFFNEKNFNLAASTPLLQTPVTDVTKESTSPVSLSNNDKELNVSNECISSSDGGNSDFSFINNSQNNIKDSRKSTSDELSSGIEDIDSNALVTTPSDSKSFVKSITTKNSKQKYDANQKRIGFIFDSTLTAFLMMGNLSPGLKTHAVTLFEVGKLCDESMDTFLSELEKVSLLDAEGEGEVCRYFAHAILLRSTICALRNLNNNIGGLDLLRLECLETLDVKTRDRLLEKKYKFLISAAPLTCILTNQFSIPIFGPFYKSSDNSHIWSKLFYYHICGYGPPSLLLKKGTVLQSLPRIFLGYGKLLVTILHTDSYIINTKNYYTLNDQLKNGCVLIQAIGTNEPGDTKYEAFPFDRNDATKAKWFNHRGIAKLSTILNMQNTCGYITFINTGVVDIGCEDYDINVHLERPQGKSGKKKVVSPSKDSTTVENVVPPLKSPDENYFSITPPLVLQKPESEHTSPSNVYRSPDCNELLEKELDKLNEDNTMTQIESKLVSQSSIEIPIEECSNQLATQIIPEDEQGEEWTILDVNFGVPLFDVDCNTSICERLCKHLTNDENISKLMPINEGMNNKFMKFISQCLYYKDENIELIKFGKYMPQPQTNLAFENGKICYWNSK